MQYRIDRREAPQGFRPIEIHALGARKRAHLEAAFEKRGSAARDIAVTDDQQAFHQRHSSEMSK
jgi:hypothetical protein